MREIGAFEAKNRLGTLLDWVEQGEEVVITRRGQPVARLIAHSPAGDRSAARAAAQRMLDRARGVTLGPGLTLRELVDEGRR